MAKKPARKKPVEKPRGAVGRPSALTPESHKIIIEGVEGGATFVDACHMAGVSDSVMYRWQEYAKRPGAAGEEFREFFRDLEGARVKRRKMYRQTALALTVKKEDFRGIAWLASVTEPKEFSPKIHVHVEHELNLALKNLKEEFSDEPDILERALTAISRGAGAERLTVSEAFSSGTVDEEGNSVDAAQAVAAAIGIPRPDM